MARRRVSPALVSVVFKDPKTRGVITSLDISAD